MWCTIVEKITSINFYNYIYNKHIMLIRRLSCAIGLEDMQNSVECGSSADAFKNAPRTRGALKSAKGGQFSITNPPEADINKSFHST